MASLKEYARELSKIVTNRNPSTTFFTYSGSRLSEIQEPHPQPPPRKRGGGL
jgi:hypothetical protein